MPGSAVRGTLAIGLEPATAPGMQNILTQQVLSAAVSASNQPVLTSGGITGVRLYILVQNVAPGTSSTITIAGLAPNGVTAVTETTTAISQATADVNGNYYYCTRAIYGSISTSGITASSYVTSLVSANVTVYGITSAKYLIPATAKFEETYDIYSPQDIRGIQDKDIRMTQMIKHIAFDLTSNLYPESEQFLGPLTIAQFPTPSTPASIPASPTVLHTGASFTSLTATWTLTTQPTSPGMLLIFVIAGNSLAGTLTITGTAWNTGAPQSETISVTAATPNGTFYSTYSYATVTNITVTGFTGAATVATSGAFAFNPIFNPTNLLATGSAEWYSGTQSSVYPYMVIEETSMEYDVNKELKWSMKGVAQEQANIGDTTSTDLTTTGIGLFPTYAQPVDYELVGWPGKFFIDPIGSTPGTTGWGDIITFKIQYKTGLKPYWTATGNQWYNRVGRTWRETTWEAEIDFLNLIRYNQYRSFQKFAVVAKFISPAYLGSSGTTSYNKTVIITLNTHLTKFVITPKEEKVTAMISGTAEYDPISGYSNNLQFINQNSPNYLT